MRDAGQLLGAPDQLLELVLDRVVELEPVRVEDLEAVVSAGLCEAETMIPAANGAVRGEERERRRRHDADDVDVDAEARRARPRSRPRTCRPTGACPGRPRSSRPRPTSRCAVARPRAKASVGFRSTLAIAADAVGAEQAGHGGQPPRRRWPRRDGPSVGDTVTVTVAGSDGDEGQAGREVRRHRHVVDPTLRPATSSVTTMVAPDSRSRSAVEPPIVTRTRSIDERVGEVRAVRRPGRAPPRTSASPSPAGA